MFAVKPTYESINALIKSAAGIVDGYIDGVFAYYDIKPMYERDGYSTYRRVPSGRFQINVSVPGQTRQAIFRTKIKDGSFDLDGVVLAIKHYVKYRSAMINVERTKMSNADAARNIREAYPLNKTYLSAYAGSSGSYVAPSAIANELYVQINFGSVTPEMAETIMAFAKSVGA